MERGGGIRRKKVMGMEEVVSMYIREMKLEAGLNVQRVFAAWDSVSGAGGCTVRRFFKGGTLYVGLSSSMVRTHLSFRKGEILNAMNDFLRKDPLFSGISDGEDYVKQLILK